MDNDTSIVTGEYDEDMEYEEIQDSYIEGEDVVYSTGEAAKILDIPRDTLRYYLQGLEEYITIEKTSDKKRAHLRFHSKDIEVLRTIVRLRKAGKPIEIIKEILDSPDMISYMSGGDKFNASLIEILTKNNDMLLSKFIEYQEQRTALEDQKRKDLLAQQNLLLEQKQHEFDSIQNELQQQNEKFRDEIKVLTEQINSLTNLVEERVPEKKGILGFRRKNKR